MKQTDYSSKRLRSVQIKLAVFVLIFFVAIACAYFSYNYITGIVNRNDEDIDLYYDKSESLEVEIPLGSNTQDIADILYGMKIIKQPKIFKLISKFNGYDGRYRSGIHLVGKKVDYNNAKGYDDLMRILADNPVSNPTISVTIPEGYTYGQIVDLFIKKGLTTKEEFDGISEKTEFDYDFLNGIPEGRTPKLEGYLFPETYIFDTRAGSEHLIGKMLNQFNVVFKQAYIDRAEEIGWSIDDIIILASIIEREAMAEGDRALISGVFHNRLKSKDQSLHLLQSCATIQYIYLQEQGVVRELITQEDTQMDHPYNTYKYTGLPPGPISCPGEASIIAALYPDTEDGYYYFVAKGDGTHAFSKTFDEHVNNMIKYNQLLR
ncbi:MAG: endolytic transglycosylase MltG [Eubacteriales bacterium]|nr:endolytic transglycosylase MltG [Eubacteriales bacterium]